MKIRHALIGAKTVFRFVFTAIVTATLLIPSVPPMLGGETERSTEEQTLFRVMYRIGSTAEWREAVEAGSPVETEEKAIEIGNLVKEKFDDGGLAVFEIEVRKVKVLTRLATVEEKKGYSEAISLVDKTGDQDNTSEKTGLAVVKRITSAALNPSSTATPFGLHHGGDSTQSRPLADGSTNGGDNLGGLTANNSDKPFSGATTQSPISSSGAQAVIPSGTLVYDDSFSKSNVGSTSKNAETLIDARKSIGEASRTATGTGSADAQNPAVYSVKPITVAPNNTTDALNSLVKLLKQQSASTSGEPTGRPTYAATLAPVQIGFDPSFFNSIPVVQYRPQVGRRLRVIRNGQEVVRIDYDINGTKIAEQTTSQSESEESASPKRPEYASDRKSGENLIMVDDESLQQERDSLVRRKSELEKREDALDADKSQLDKEQVELDREAEVLKKRERELQDQEKKGVETLIEGRSASGTLAGGKKLSFKFEPGGSLTANDGIGNYSGNWKLDGEQFTIKVADSTLTGRLTGDQISGTRSKTGGTSDGWNVSLPGLGSLVQMEQTRRSDAELQHAQNKKRHQNKQAELDFKRTELKKMSGTLQAEKRLYEDDYQRVLKQIVANSLGK